MKYFIILASSRINSCLFFAFSIFLCAPTSYATEKNSYFLLDGGLGISPHSLLGGSFGLRTNQHISIEIGAGLVGSRASILGPSFTTIITKQIPDSRFSFVLGNVLYSGKGIRTIVFKNSCEKFESSDNRCNERTHELHVPADREAQWTYAYWMAGTRFFLEESASGTYWDLGLTRCWYGNLKVKNAPNDDRYGPVLGVEIDSSYFLGNQYVRPGDAGFYLGIGHIFH